MLDFIWFIENSIAIENSNMPFYNSINQSSQKFKNIVHSQLLLKMILSNFIDLVSYLFVYLFIYWLVVYQALSYKEQKVSSIMTFWIKQGKQVLIKYPCNKQKLKSWQSFYEGKEWYCMRTVQDKSDPNEI